MALISLTFAASESRSSWNPYLHPEGQLYFQRQFSNYAVVTEANLHRKDIENRVHSWLESIDDIIAEQQMEVPPSSELFIELDDSLSSCGYYFVNHRTRRLFWLEQTTTELLNIGMVVSPSHVGMHLDLFRIGYPHNSRRHSFGKALLDSCRALPYAYLSTSVTQCGR